ncbi:MAG: DUF2264 domain-containing protein, partial [Hungatella sp.]
MKYTVHQPNYGKSPYTGMTRTHWLELSHFFLEGIFSHIRYIEDPIVFPRHEYEVSYPRPNGPAWRIAAERFEGLARSFLIGAPLLHNEPEAVVCGYSMKEYYKKQILLSVTPGTPNYLLRVEEIFPEALPGEKAFQHTCECASLVIGLTICREVIWESYTKEEQDLIADYLSNFGHSYTGHHNWRLFNMLILAFLDREGYPIDADMMRDHTQAILSYYAGNGWYRDGHLFDYYSPWAFQVYGPLWNQWYGYEKEPALAAKIERYSNELMQTYDRMFDEDGHVTMWGRSGSYRSAASAPLAANFLLREAQADPGLARRIASGAVLQFVTREECFKEGVPCLGFYGPFRPFVQSYSCAASPFWIANSFVCLALPEDHPYWSTVEANGIWEQMQPKETQTTVLNGPGIVLDNHKATGITEFRTGKILVKKDYSSLNAYSRLSFNSQFPWEDFDFAGAETMQYSLKAEKQNNSRIPNILMYAGVRDGVLYRKEYFDFEFTFQDKASIDLADFAVSHGIVRVDKVRIPDKPYTLTLGSYGMADRGHIEIEERICPITGAKAMILKSEEGQIALVSYSGFDEIGQKNRRGVSAVTECSCLLYAESRRNHYYEYRPYAMISAMLTKKDNTIWSDEELFPILAIHYA